MTRSLLFLVWTLALPAAAQPYTIIEARSLPATPGAETLPPREALELAYQARLSTPQFEIVIERAAESGDPSLIPVLWRVARAYAQTGSFDDQIFQALRRLGERDETFIAEAERVAPTIPAPIRRSGQLTLAERVHNHNVTYLRVYVRHLVRAAAARADSALLPRVLALDQANESTRDASLTYRNALQQIAGYEALPPDIQLQRAVGAAIGGYYVEEGSNGPGRPFLFGPALDAGLVYGREQLPRFYATDPLAVEAALEAALVERGLNNRTFTTGLRAYVLQAAATPPPVELPPPGPPVCLFGPATVWVDAAGLVHGGPLDGQPYAGQLTGTDANDILVATDADDTIDAGAGNDLVCALGGNDTVTGGDGNDLLVGGPGDDRLDGAGGTDTADGGDGTDACDAETTTACEGGLGTPAPTCAGQPATVYVSADGLVVGGPLAGQSYAGRLLGTDGPDTIAGTDAADLLDGRAGDDTLCGAAGDDALVGGDGTDTALGGDGADGCDAETATACEGAVPALADVRPVLECVRDEPGGALTAFFGYENRSGRPGRRAYGSSNRLTPAAFDRRQPDLFALPGVVAGRPGRTPFYPGHAFTVRFEPGQQVVWRLGSRTSTASSSSTRCPE